MLYIHGKSKRQKKSQYEQGHFYFTTNFINKLGKYVIPKATLKKKNPRTKCIHNFCFWPSKRQSVIFNILTLSTGPVIVNVFPEPVWPYAKAVHEYPSKAFSTIFLMPHLSTTSCCDVVGSKMALKVNVFVLPSLSTCDEDDQERLDIKVWNREEWDCIECQEFLLYGMI